MREHGARVEDYKGVRLIVADRSDSAARRPALASRFHRAGLVPSAAATLVRGAVDLKNGGGQRRSPTTR